MFEFFGKKKIYLIKWQRNCFVSLEQHETTIRARCEADAVWKFLQGRSPNLEKLEIESVQEVDYE